MVFRTLLLACFAILATTTLAQQKQQVNIFLPEFFKQQPLNVGNQNWQVDCYDKHGNQITGFTENFIEVVAFCECFELSSKKNDFVLRYTFRRLSPVIWERADHNDYGRVQLFFDLPSNVISTDTLNHAYTADSKALIVKHYYQLRQCN